MYVLASAIEMYYEDPSPGSRDWNVIDYRATYANTTFIDTERYYYVHLNTSEEARQVAVFRNSSGGLALREIKVFGYQGNIFLLASNMTLMVINIYNLSVFNVF